MLTFKALAGSRGGGHGNAPTADLERGDLLLGEADQFAKLRLGQAQRQHGA